MDATTVAVDLAKDVFEVAPANRAGRIVDRRRLAPQQFARFVEGLDAGTTVVMEACGTARIIGASAGLTRHLARTFRSLRSYATRWYAGLAWRPSQQT